MIPNAFELNLTLVSISVSAYIVFACMCFLPSLIFLMVYHIVRYIYHK